MLRLVEHQPAWEVHSALRFFGISYSVDFSPMPTALGKSLPLLIDNDGMYGGTEIFDCISRHSMKSVTASEKVIDELVSNTLLQRFGALWATLSHRTLTARDEAMQISPWGLNIYLGHLLDLQKLFATDR
jgi:hypothetical protein